MSDEFGEKEIVGYCDRWSVVPGDSIRFMTSCEPDSYRADVVKLVCGDANPDGPGYREEPIDADVNGVYPGREQRVTSGSHVIAPDAPQLRSPERVTVGAFIYPTIPAAGEQGILTKWTEHGQREYGLFVDADGCLSLRIATDTGELIRLSLETPLKASTWYFVAASVDLDSGRAVLCQRPPPEGNRPLPDPQRSLSDSKEIGIEPVDVPETDTPFLIAASMIDDEGTEERRPVSHFNGKIDRPGVLGDFLPPSELDTLAEEGGVRHSDPIAAWDFAADVTDDGVESPDVAIDTGPHELHGRVINMPSRGVPGFNWQHERVDFTDAPEQFAAIHFHEDDLIDANWDVDFEWTVPEAVESAVYAARLRTEREEYYVPFFVRRPVGEPTADVLFLAPTNSYLAYANPHGEFDTEIGGGDKREPMVEEGHVFLNNHREYGLSMYDTHVDGSGVMFSSRLRPLINVSPKFVRGGAPPSHLHQLAADLYLVDWLEAKGYEYDVATDEDLHRDGVDRLDSYNVVVTGHHPEYHSREMLDAIESYRDRGGRLVYLGGNGFYWMITYHPERPQIIETRRAETGSEPWKPAPGEKYHMFTGRKGGLWKELGRPPNSLVGVGCSAVWEVVGAEYHRHPDSYEPETEFVFEGVESESFGDFGLLGGGAASQELDRYDTDRGSPEHAYLLAYSRDHTEHAPRVIDELSSYEYFRDGTVDHKTRADMVYFRTPNDGAVFSTGAMGWVGSLSHNEYDNDVSRILANVLDAFASDGKLPVGTEEP